MLYRAECMSGYTDNVSPLYTAEEEAYSWLYKVPCRMDDSIKSCDSCQAEWMVCDYNDKAEADKSLSEVKAWRNKLQGEKR